MNQHLSLQQIDEWVIGERKPDVEAHLQACQTCADEVARIGGPLTLFRGAVRNWSEEQMGPVRPWVPAGNRNAGFGWGIRRIGLGFATLLLLVAAPVYLHRQVTREAALAAAQDEMLLRQVQSEISRSVPAPLEPLAKLMPDDFSR